MNNEYEFLKIQNYLRDKINLSDRINKSEIKTVAGVDLAYWKNENQEEYAVCCIVVIDCSTHEIIEKNQYSSKIKVPYVSGFLTFRELPLVLKTAEKLKVKPDIYMFDGNGYLHPRNMGIATHASFCLDTPSIGVAKTYFKVNNTDYTEPDSSAGSFTDIIIDGKIYGRALRTHGNIKPVFVSAGNYISLDTATEITLKLIDKESHIPIPTRLADLETHKARNILTGR